MNPAHPPLPWPLFREAGWWTEPDAVTPDFLAWAAGQDDPCIVEAVLQSLPKEVLGTARAGSEPLLFPLITGHPDMVPLAIQRGADVTQKDAHGNTVLIHAATEQVALVPFLIAAGVEINAHNDTGHTALMRVCANTTDNTNTADGIDLCGDAVRALIGAGVDLNAQGGMGSSALHHAVRRRPDLAALLLEAGAHPDLSSVLGVTPLMEAAQWRPEAMRPLLNAGASADRLREFMAKSGSGDVHADAPGILAAWTLQKKLAQAVPEVETPRIRPRF